MKNFKVLALITACMLTFVACGSSSDSSSDRNTESSSKQDETVAEDSGFTAKNTITIGADDGVMLFDGKKATVTLADYETRYEGEDGYSFNSKDLKTIVQISQSDIEVGNQDELASRASSFSTKEKYEYTAFSYGDKEGYYMFYGDTVLSVLQDIGEEHYLSIYVNYSGDDTRSQEDMIKDYLFEVQ